MALPAGVRRHLRARVSRAPRPGLRCTVAGVALVAMTAACATGRAPAAPPATAPATPPATAPSMSPPAASAAPSPTVPPAGSSVLPSTAPSPGGSPGAVAPVCERRGVAEVGTIANAELVETSGLVASRARPGVLWAHNDGGDRLGVFAVGDDGADLGFHPIDDGEALGLDVVDVEDIAIIGPAGAADILLADIGDNAEVRDTIALLRFPEPEPGSGRPISGVEVLRYRYPDGPHNAETLLVDEAADRVVIVTKEQEAVPEGGRAGFGRTERSAVFEGALDGAGSDPIELVAAGTIDTLDLEARAAPSSHPASLLGFGGVPTGGDVSADGSTIAIRTYETVWAWPRAADQSVAAALQGAPCEVASATEAQGEAIAFVGDELVTVGEGPRRRMHRLGVG